MRLFLARRHAIRQRGFRAAGFDVTREFFALRCDNQLVAWQAVLAGLGVGIGMRRVADTGGDLVRVLPEGEVPSLPLWATAHRELHGTLRLKLAFDALVATLAPP